MPAGCISPGDLAGSDQLLKWEGVVRSNGYQGELSWPLNTPLVLKPSFHPFICRPVPAQAPGHLLGHHSALLAKSTLSAVARATHPVAFLPNTLRAGPTCAAGTAQEAVTEWQPHPQPWPGKQTFMSSSRLKGMLGRSLSWPSTSHPV